MVRESKVLLGIDPGKTTGWTVGRGSTVIGQGQTPDYDFVSMLKIILAGFDIDMIAIERFDPRSWTPDSVKTVELIGAIKQTIVDCNLEYIEVPASAKQATAVSVDKEIVTGGHARDAEAIRLWAQRYGKW